MQRRRKSWTPMSMSDSGHNQTSKTVQNYLIERLLMSDDETVKTPNRSSRHDRRGDDPKASGTNAVLI